MYQEIQRIGIDRSRQIKKTLEVIIKMPGQCALCGKKKRITLTSRFIFSLYCDIDT